MSRIRGVEPREKGFFARLFIAFAYWMSRRELGKVVQPLRVRAHSPAVLWGYGQMELALKLSRRLPAQLKDLAHVRTSMLVGCEF